MHLAIHPPGVVESPAARLLGSGHPLVRALDWRASLHVAAVMVGALLCGSLAFSLHVEATRRLAVALAAGVVEALTCLAFDACGDRDP